MNAEARQVADNDGEALTSWHEWQVDGRQRRIILCVETALELQPEKSGFDPAALEALISQAAGLMKASPSPIDSFRIVPRR